jgi:hypothetical protein
METLVAAECLVHTIKCTHSLSKREKRVEWEYVHCSLSVYRRPGHSCTPGADTKFCSNLTLDIYEALNTVMKCASSPVIGVYFFSFYCL